MSKKLFTGYIRWIDGDDICATVFPVEGHDEIDITFAREHLSESERPYLAEGAYLSLFENGEIEFSKEVWSEEDLLRGRNEAAKICNSINWE